MMVYNSTRGRLVASTTEFAVSFLGRLRGLLGRGSIPDTHALYLYPSNAIHTCFMAFDIDILFMNMCGWVVHIENRVKPFKFTGRIKDAHYVIELAAGRADSTATLAGDQLLFCKR